MSYFSLLPKDLKELLLLYVADRDIAIVMTIAEFKSLFDYESGTFWKLKVKEQYPSDYRKDMPPLYYLNVATSNMTRKIRHETNLIIGEYSSDPNYINLSNQEATLRLQLENTYSAMNKIREQYRAIAEQHNTQNLLQQHTISRNFTLHYFDDKPTLIKHYFFYYFDNSDSLKVSDWLDLLSSPNMRAKLFKRLHKSFGKLHNGTLIGIGPIKKKPDILMYIYQTAPDKEQVDYEYTVMPDSSSKYKIILPNRFIEDMRQLGLSGGEINNTYNLPFKISDSDIYF